MIAISKHEMSMSDRWKKLHLMLKCVNRTHCLLPNMHLRTLCSVCYHGCGVHCKTIPSCVLEAAVLCCAVDLRNRKASLTNVDSWTSWISWDKGSDKGSWVSLIFDRPFRLLTGDPAVTVQFWARVAQSSLFSHFCPNALQIRP